MAEFRSQNQELVRLAQRDLQDFWGALNLGNPDRSRDLLLEFFPDLLADYSDTAAVLGADFYDMLRDAPPSSAKFKAILSQPTGTDQAQGALRWAVGPLFEQDEASALGQLLGATQRLVLQPGRDSIFESTRSDPAGLRFARVPSGKTCQFCTMLASRGFVYASKKSAGQDNSWHDDCDCVIVPGNGVDDYPEGFDLNEYRAAYRSGTGIDGPNH